MSPLANKVALVTGASSGIGRAVALTLAAHGARLWMVGRSGAKLEGVADIARGLASHVRHVAIDLSSDDAVFDLVDRVQRGGSGLDMLIHSAGRISLGSTEHSDIGHLDDLYRINVRAPYLLTQRLLPLLRMSHGQIVFMNSSAGQHACADCGQYASTKHALKAIADSLRHEVNADGVRVLSVYPGRTATPMQEDVHTFESRPYHPADLLRPEDVATVVVNALCAASSAEITDIHVRPMRKTQ